MMDRCVSKLAVLRLSVPAWPGRSPDRRPRDARAREPGLRLPHDCRRPRQRRHLSPEGYVLKIGGPTATWSRPAGPRCGASRSCYPGAITALIRDYLDRARNGDRLREDPLTPREQEIVKLIAESYSNQLTADALVISVKTVERHRANILKKLGMHDKVQLTRYAIRRGLIDP
jgi:DNA-binding CsgD family transcriptional regulator